MIARDSNNTATKGNVCWGLWTEFLKPKCSTCPDLCQLTSARNVEPEPVDFPPPPKRGGVGGLVLLVQMVANLCAALSNCVTLI